MLSQVEHALRTPLHNPTRWILALCLGGAVLAAGIGCNSSTEPDDQYEFPHEITETIPLVDEPGVIELLPGGDLLVAQSAYLCSFEVVDLENQISLGSFSSGTSSNPLGLAPHPSEPIIYLCDGGPFLAVVETDSFSVTDSIWIGGNINGVHVDNSGSYILATDWDGDVLHVVDSESDSVVSVLALPAPPVGNMAYATGMSVAYIVCGTYPSEVVAVSIPDATQLASVQVGELAESICLLPSEQYAYVSCRPMMVIRISDNTVVDSIPALTFTSPQISSLPSGDYVYVGSGLYELGVVDTQTNEVVVSIPLEDYDLAGLAVSPDGQRVYVAVDGHQIFILE